MRTEAVGEGDTGAIRGGAGDDLLITCEHGGNRIPPAYRDLFAPHRELLDTHRGFDAGAILMARELAAAFGAPLVAATVSRLLVDLNRSVGHPKLHFDALRSISPEERQRILTAFYHPYRHAVERFVRQMIADNGRVIHISSHSFTPVLDGKVRHADIGLLYDPARSSEASLCAGWKTSLNALMPALTVRRNYPYAGKNDGVTSWLRRDLPAASYLGIEIEINQKHVAGSRRWRALRQAIIESLRQALCATPSAQGQDVGSR